MRFLVDECCHRAFVVALREVGHDVRYTAETDRRATDAELTALAIAEDRLLITADYDFGELAVRRREPIPGNCSPPVWGRFGCGKLTRFG